MNIMQYIDALPSPTKVSLDITAVATALGTGILTFFEMLQTPLAGLASLAALVYTVLRIIQLRREMKKGQ